MKLREEVMEYHVRYHGTEYEDPDNPNPGVCPECQSVDVRASTDDDFTSADWVCNACGCRFDSHIASKRTKLGIALSKVIMVVIVILIIASSICLFAGIIWFEYKKRELGEESITDSVRLKGMAISIGGPIICCLLCGVMAWIEDKI